ncbi:hypothetical protein L9F63_028117, partial [Diploptera punctata]
KRAGGRPPPQPPNRGGWGRMPPSPSPVPFRPTSPYGPSPMGHPASDHVGKATQSPMPMPPMSPMFGCPLPCQTASSYGRPRSPVHSLSSASVAVPFATWHAAPTGTASISSDTCAGRGRCQTQSLAKRRETISLTTTAYSPKIFVEIIIATPAVKVYVTFFSLTSRYLYVRLVAEYVGVPLEPPGPPGEFEDPTQAGLSTADIIASQSQDYVDEKLAEYQATIHQLQEFCEKMENPKDVVDQVWRFGST